jgi:hypothetical protein
VSLVKAAEPGERGSTRAKSRPRSPLVSPERRESAGTEGDLVPRKNDRRQSVVTMKEAVEATCQTLEARARLYRNLVVAVVAMVTSTVGASLLLWSPRPLAALVALIPICGAFLLLDGRLVEGWLRTVFARREASSFRLSDLKRLLRAHRYIPQRSLMSMLALLPHEDAGESGRLAGVEAILREARLQQRRTLLGTAIATLLVGIPAGASVMTPMLLALCLGGTMVILAGLATS